MNKFADLNSREKEILEKLKESSKKKAIYKKVVFHIHTPASYDYSYFDSKDNFYKGKVNDIVAYLNQSTALISEALLENFSKGYDSQHEALAYLLMAKKLLENKVELALVTDHNTFSGFTKLENAIAFLYRHHKNKFKSYTNLLLGIEISCADSHVVGIFDYEQNCLEERIDGLENTFKEYLLDEKHGSFKTSLEMLDIINENKGLGYIAHINSSNLLSNDSLSISYKKRLFSDSKTSVLGVKDLKNLDTIQNRLKTYAKQKEFSFVLDEDSHSFDGLASNCFWIIGSKCSFEMIRNAFHDPNFTICLSPPCEPDVFIEGIAVEPFNEKKGYYIGKENRKSLFNISFSSSLSCLIGSRGTGKSTLLNLMDFVLSQRTVSCDDLLFLNSNMRVMILVKYINNRYLIKYLAPDIDNFDEISENGVLKYFGVHDRIENSTFDYESSTMKKYIINNLLYIYKISKNDRLISLDSKSKQVVLNNIYDEHYSINELVEKSKSNDLNAFIKSKLVNKRFPEFRYRAYTKQFINNITKYFKNIEDYKNILKENCDNFNKYAENLIQLNIEIDNKIEQHNIKRLLNDFNMHKFDEYIGSERLEAYLTKIIEENGIEYFITSIRNNDLTIFNSVSINGYTKTLSYEDITKGKKSLDDEKNKKDFFDKLLNGLNILLKDNYLLRYFQSSYQDAIQVGLEFNVNSNNENVSKPIFKSIKNISLGQKVVAILDFIFIYGQFTDDRKPLLIDQPEDNLDNSYIYENLVQNLIQEKAKRQVIIATHNSTIVTNAKAECVIVMESDNERSWVHQVGYPYEKKMIKLILKYLEGGEASFKHKEFVYAPVLND